MEKYINKIEKLLEKIELEENNSINEVCNLMYETMKKGKMVHIFATGHSHMFAEELFYRAGGLVPINPILEPFLMQHEGAVRSTKFERISGISEVIYNSLETDKEEPFIIVSNSGINAVPIEMAKIAKKNGHKVIGLTSVESSKQLKSRDKEDKHLYEVCDYVIDNHTPMGDGVFRTKYGYIGASSTILNSFIAQKIVLGIIDLYEAEGQVPPIYISANTEGGDEHNQKLINKFKGKIRCLY